MLKVLLDVIPGELRNETPDVLVVLELLGVCRLLLYCANLGIELSDVEEVTSAAATLSKSVASREGIEQPTAESSYLVLCDLPGHSRSNLNGESGPGLDLLWLCKHSGRASRRKDGGELHDGSMRSQKDLLTRA
jgi:hypothetical protein